MTSPPAPSIVTVSASIPSYMSVWYMAPPFPSGFRSQLGFDRLAFDQPETAASFHRLERREVAESRRLNLTVRLIVTPWMIILAELNVARRRNARRSPARPFRHGGRRRGGRRQRKGGEHPLCLVGVPLGNLIRANHRRLSWRRPLSETRLEPFRGTGEADSIGPADSTAAAGGDCYRGRKR